jgi:aarF domain-containing kinase
MFRSLLSASAKLTGVMTVGGGGYVAYLYETDEGTNRAIRAYSALVPVVLHYRWVELLDKVSPQSEETWRDLDSKYAKPTVERLGELQGMYTKYGQTAAGLTNTFGEQWIHELRKLESEVPPRPIEIVYKTIEEETGKPVDQTFSYLDPIPLGSASIGQVHRARLRRNDKDVCVKIQYPDSGRLFRKDIAAIRKFCETLAPEHVVTLSALEKQNASELDYTNEANNLLEVASNMKKHGFLPSEVVVPLPVLDLCTKRMLVMDFLEGPKLVDGIRAYYQEWAHLNGTTLEKLEEDARRQIENEGIPAKYDGPNATQIALYRQYLAAKDTAWNVCYFLYNWSFGFWVSRTIPYQHSSIPPNTPRIVDTLMRVHGYQLFADGLFQSDPHGGNFILLPDGRLGLIDYGATKRLTRNERLTACLIYAALRRRDEDMLLDMSKIGGYKSKYGKKEVLMKLLEFGYDSWGHDVTGGKNLQQFIDDLKREDPWEEVPDNFVMAQFMSIRLRSLALGMNHPVKCSEWWGPIAEKILEQEGLPYESWDYEQLVKYKPELNMQKHKFG